MEVGATEQVAAAAARLKGAGLATFEENDTACCYAVQDKVWVTGPGKEPWEVYVVKGDADVLDKGAEGAPDACCADRARNPAPTAATGCSCGT